MSIKILIIVLVIWVTSAEIINHKNVARINRLEEDLRREKRKNSKRLEMNRQLIKLRKYGLEEQFEPKGDSDD